VVVLKLGDTRWSDIRLYYCVCCVCV